MNILTGIIRELVMCTLCINVSLLQRLWARPVAGRPESWGVRSLVGEIGFVNP